MREPGRAVRGGHGCVAGVNLERLMANRKTPERLERDLQEITGSDTYRYVAPQQGGRDVFLVAQTWCALSEAIDSGGECSPSFHDKAKIHRVWDAAERSSQEKRWVTIDYSGLGMRSGA
jgi:hypothetical protein